MRKFRSRVASFQRNDREQNAQNNSDREEFKFEEVPRLVIEEEMNTDYARKKHDFSKISEADLAQAFILLRSRCPDSWKPKYEERATALHRMFMTLRSKNIVDLIDPRPKFAKRDELFLELKDGDEPTAGNLIAKPKLWNMESKESAMEFSEILRHLTRFAPFKGRPFIRAWLEALRPCFCRWVLLSVDVDTFNETSANKINNSVVVETLKHFLGAFGQPGIVVCLVDRGAPMLRTLQSAARSVQAIGRGEAERYYWKRIMESTCGGTNNWAELSGLEDVPLKLSQLDHLPREWLQDANDWANVFAEVVSAEITPIFEKLVKDTVCGKKNASVHAGPPKTLSRSLAKGEEYLTDFQNGTNIERWSHFGKKFQENFGRTPNKPVDFVWNIVDFARCSIEVPTASDVLDVKKLVEDRFEVVCIKNGYNANFEVKGSGYRDMKLLVKVEFDDLSLKHIPKMEQKTVLICEIQVICKAWLVNKKTTSLSYKILRGNSMRDLFKDFTKYISEDQHKIEHSALEVIKHGWINISRSVDYSQIDGEKVLIDAAMEGWDEGTVSILVNDLKVDPDSTDQFGRSPLLWAARSGSLSILKGLLAVGCGINIQSKYKSTALHWASRNGHEACVRALLAAGCDVTIRDYGWRTALERMNLQLKGSHNTTYHRIMRLLSGEHVPILNTNDGVDKEGATLDLATRAAISGWLTNFLDVNPVSISVISKLLASTATVSSLENVLQVLWFGADIETKSSDGWTALLYAANYGTLETITVLLDHGANMEVHTYGGFSPLHLAAAYNTPGVVNKIIESGASLYEKTRYNSNVVSFARKNKEHGAAILQVLLSHGVSPRRERSDESSVLSLPERKIDDPRGACVL